MSAAVVGEDNGGNAGFDRAEHVIGTLNTLEDDGHGCDGLEPGDVRPGERGVDEGGDGASGPLGTVDFV